VFCCLAARTFAICALPEMLAPATSSTAVGGEQRGGFGRRVGIDQAVIASDQLLTRRARIRHGDSQLGNVRELHSGRRLEI